MFIRSFLFLLQRCSFCNTSGANIGCCKTTCRRSFHLHCALKNDCRFEFVRLYQSFCSKHDARAIPSTAYDSKDKCVICRKKLGPYAPTKAIQSACCNSWMHKLCLLDTAQKFGDLLKCVICNSMEFFQEDIKRKSVYIPNL